MNLKGLIWLDKFKDMVNQQTHNNQMAHLKKLIRYMISEKY